MSEENQDKIIITRGEKAIFDIFLEKDSFPRCVDLTGFDLFKACFSGTLSGDVLEISEIANANGSIIEPIAGGTYGQLKITLFPIDTLLLEALFNQDIDIEWDVTAGDAPNRKRIHKALNVEDSSCS